MTKMKDSGVKWIGQIPEDWETKPIRHLMIERNEKNEYLQTTTMLSLSAKEGVTLYSEEGHTGNRPREDLSGYKVVRVGDIVVNSMNILSGAVGLSKYEGCVSPVYYTYFAREGYDIDFLNLIFQCKQFQLNLKGLGNGILIKESENGTLNTIRMRIPSDKLLKEEFPVCSLEKQKKIVEVLGVQCKKIDELIAIQEKEIEKLKEYKTSVITKAVTKGLDDSVPMKDSGIDWIGQIPKQWKYRWALPPGSFRLCGAQP
jgi:type I restriction enzyme S subunit